MDTKILLVGSGGYGAVYARQLYGAAHARENVRVAGVVDPYAAKGPLYEAICAAGTPIYNTVQEFYAQDRADLAVIATPIPLHREQASACLQAGSHVLLEKPICAEMEQAKAIAAARDASGKHLAIGFQWCWDGAMQRLRELARSGKLGAPVRLRALVIWPRDFAYYGRGSGWAGKEYDAKGNPIFDSVASNATAHYLFNMSPAARKPIGPTKSTPTIRPSSAMRCRAAGRRCSSPRTPRKTSGLSTPALCMNSSAGARSSARRTTISACSRRGKPSIWASPAATIASSFGKWWMWRAARRAFPAPRKKP